MFCELIPMTPSAAFTMCPSEVIDHRSVNMEASQEGKRVEVTKQGLQFIRLQQTNKQKS